MGGPDPALETAEIAETVGTAEVFETSAEFDWDHPENDPSHPRYEPPHLRHRPGDTWQIGGKPFDIDDRGPYGNPLWRPDRRTGRHRRGELPDPLPPETEPETGPEPSPPPGATPRPSPGPGRRGFWTETDPGQQHPGHVTGRERRRSESDTDHPEQGGGYRFDRLREDAWDHFMTDSAPLAAAHQRQPVRRSRQTALDREAGLALMMWIRLARWLFAIIRSLSTGPDPKPETKPEAGPQENPPARERPCDSARQRTEQGPTYVATPALSGAPSGSTVSPQPGVRNSTDRGRPTCPTVPVMTPAGPASCGPDTGEATSPAARLTAQAAPASCDSDRIRRTSPAARLLAQGRPATAMARAIAGAQRARAGVAAWA